MALPQGAVVGVQYVIVAFPDHFHLFLDTILLKSGKICFQYHIKVEKRQHRLSLLT